jgi:hypothetical protein
METSKKKSQKPWKNKKFLESNKKYRVKLPAD